MPPRVGWRSGGFLSDVDFDTPTRGATASALMMAAASRERDWDELSSEGERKHEDVPSVSDDGTAASKAAAASDLGGRAQVQGAEGAPGSSAAADAASGAHAATTSVTPRDDDDSVLENPAVRRAVERSVTEATAMAVASAEAAAAKRLRSALEEQSKRAAKLHTVKLHAAIQAEQARAAKIHTQMLRKALAEQAAKFAAEGASDTIGGQPASEGGESRSGSPLKSLSSAASVPLPQRPPPPPTGPGAGTGTGTTGMMGQLLEIFSVAPPTYQMNHLSATSNPPEASLTGAPAQLLAEARARWAEERAALEKRVQHAEERAAAAEARAESASAMLIEARIAARASRSSGAGVRGADGVSGDVPDRAAAAPSSSRPDTDAHSAAAHLISSELPAAVATAAEEDADLNDSPETQLDKGVSQRHHQSLATLLADMEATTLAAGQHATSLGRIVTDDLDT